MRQCIPLSLGVRCCWARACEGSSLSGGGVSKEGNCASVHTFELGGEVLLEQGL